MSAPHKPQGGSKSELTKFKLLWRDTLAEPHKDYLRSLFASAAHTQAQIRAVIMQKHGANLLYDRQLTEFRDWEFEQRQMDLEAERIEDHERRLVAEHPDWTKQQVRDELLKHAYLRARATGDYKLGFGAMKQDRAFEQGVLDERRMKLLEAKAAQADNAKVVVESKLTLEEKQLKLRQIFGMS